MNKGAAFADRAGHVETIARVAHQYYILGLTQNEIAKRLGITRFKAHRMLAQARERGMVRIEIDVSSASRLSLEDRLAHRFGLSSVFVCPSDTTPEFQLPEVIGHYAGGVVGHMIADGMTIAVSWGRTLRAMAMSIEPFPAQKLQVVPLIGSLSRRSTIDRYEASTLLAEKLGAECYYIPGPILCDSIEAKKAIDAQPVLQLALEKARHSDIALLSVGGTDMSSLREGKVLPDADYADVVQAGAVGNFMGRFIGQDGTPIDHPLNRRTIGATPDEIRNIPIRVLCAGGPNKSAAIAGVLSQGYATSLVVDEETAETLLK